MAKIVDGAQKLGFLLQQAQAAAALADAVPDPAAKRFAASGVFVALDSFVTLARQTRNAIPAGKHNRADLDKAKTALNGLGDRDWGAYAPLRDRLSAHRQPLNDGDGIAAWGAANELWAEIDAPLIGVLCDDMAEIYARLAPHAGGTPITPPVLPPLAAEALAQAPGFQPREGLSIASGSFGETIAATLSPLQGGEVGQRLREVADTIDAYSCYGEISQCVVGQLLFGRAALRGAIIEAANIVELVFEVPEGRAAENYFDPLVDLIPTNYREAGELRAEFQRLSAADLKWLRGLRNSVAGHIDAVQPLAQLLADLDSVPPTRLNGLFGAACEALESVDKRHPITVLSPLVRLYGKRLQGLERIDPPELNQPYDR
jgi:hypothetical protein